MTPSACHAHLRAAGLAHVQRVQACEADCTTWWGEAGNYPTPRGERSFLDWKSEMSLLPGGQ